MKGRRDQFVTRLRRPAWRRRIGTLLASLLVAYGVVAAIAPARVFADPNICRSQPDGGPATPGAPKHLAGFCLQCLAGGATLPAAEPVRLAAPTPAYVEEVFPAQPRLLRRQRRIARARPRAPPAAA